MLFDVFFRIVFYSVGCILYCFFPIYRAAYTVYKRAHVGWTQGRNRLLHHTEDRETSRYLGTYMYNQSS